MCAIKTRKKRIYDIVTLNAEKSDTRTLLFQEIVLSTLSYVEINENSIVFC